MDHHDLKKNEVLSILMTISVMELVMKVGTVADVSSLLTGTVWIIWFALRPSLFLGLNH